MATPYNPWQSPPSSGALTGDLASFEINGMDGPDSETEDSAEAPEAEDLNLANALSVINQQSQLITKLMDMLGGSK